MGRWRGDAGPSTSLRFAQDDRILGWVGVRCRIPSLNMPLPRRLHSLSRFALLAALSVALVSCGGRRSYVAPTGPMPANTVLLSEMMQELSAQPGFTEAMLAQLGKNGRNGPALLTPKLVDRMREMILGKDWQGLNRFPGWTMREINPTVRVVGHVAGKSDEAESLAKSPHGGAGASARTVKAFLDLGTLHPDSVQRVELDVPSKLPGFSEEGIVSQLGYGVTRGDGADPAIAPMHAESERMAEVLNRLSLNGMDGAAPAVAEIGGREARTPEALMDALVAAGHTVMVADARYFANFGHFHYRGQDVMMPFWVNTQVLVPGTRRPLLLPVVHAEYEWFIRGPKVNADVAFYFGIDGKAEFRTMDELNQPWVLGWHAHEYRGGEAREVTRLNGLMVAAYLRQHMARPALPFGGYYALGVCQDTVAAIEKKMTGRATLFPNTADASLFNDPRDAEVNQLIAAIPKDRAGAPPQPERIFGSLPTDDFRAITIPGLADDLVRSESAWREGKLKQAHGRWWFVVWSAVWGAMVIALGVALVSWRRRRRSGH